MNSIVHHKVVQFVGQFFKVSLLLAVKSFGFELFQILLAFLRLTSVYFGQRLCAELVVQTLGIFTTVASLFHRLVSFLSSRLLFIALFGCIRRSRRFCC